MSLAEIQRMMLKVTISPDLSDELFVRPEAAGERFGLEEEELRAARQLPRKVIESFQYAVAHKRLSKSALPFVRRTLSLLTYEQTKRLTRDFLRGRDMHQNEWAGQLTAFLDFAAAQAEPARARLFADITSFEKWMYTCATSPAPPQSNQAGYSVAPHVHFRAFPYPSELIIEERLDPELLEQHCGQTGYVLCCPDSGKIDLYEIDQACFELLLSCREPVPMEALSATADRIVRAYAMDKEPQELISELLEMNIIVSTEGEDE
ncbi:hypothetical protein ACFFSY_17130 [Paenibacillus aurantiacus]|uniref:DNA-binding domain-containing protein n=1 Tax=Paenibacillus aurantiacus TaxID=1936118 RepID=A0ABV5KQZ4_9BACL